MTPTWELSTLAALYDRGHLVPFIGSGMSIGECANWKNFVTQLENYAEGQERGNKSSFIRPSATLADPIRRAAAVLQAMRCRGVTLGEAVRASVYDPEGKGKTTHSAALATLYWPLVCTTNYDDVYLREAVSQRSTLPRILGRSEDDCRRVLQHMAMPSNEVIWAIQGFLSPRFPELNSCVGQNPARLESELVVGPVEYREVAYRAPHFRRCFAEMFRHRSFLFLGSGLAEPYLLALFDEIIELVGPPPRPHFALVPEGSLDVAFMLEQYHIVCRTYKHDGAHDEEHKQVSIMLRQLAEFIQGNRSRAHRWGYRLQTPSFVKKEHCNAHFQVVRAPLPALSDLGADEVLAISCGRDINAETPLDKRGKLIPSSLIHSRVPANHQSPFVWHDDWTVNWSKYDQRMFGVVARLPIEEGVRSSRDARSPEAIRLSFISFLGAAASRGAAVAHVQLLAAGSGRIFHPWVSLIQMARGYGQWFKTLPLTTPPVHIMIYVVAPDVMLLLNGGYLDLTEHLEDAPIRISVEMIDYFGRTQTSHQLVDASTTLGSLSTFTTKSGVSPRVHVLPTPQLRSVPMRLNEIIDMQLRDLGLVSGSTLVVDYRRA